MDPALEASWDRAIALVTGQIAIDLGEDTFEGASPMASILKEVTDLGPVEAASVMIALAQLQAGAVKHLAENEGLGTREKWQRVCATIYDDD